MALYYKFAPRSAPYMPLAASGRDGSDAAPAPPSRLARYRIRFEADVERQYGAAADPLSEISRFITASSKDFRGIRIFTAGSPLRQSDQPQVSLSLESVPSSGPMWFVGGGQPGRDIIGVRVTGRAKSDKSFADAQKLVRQVYDLFIASWLVELT